MNMKRNSNYKLLVKLLYILAFIIQYSIFTNPCFSQNTGVAINTVGAAADASAILDVSSTTQGTLITRMTTIQRDAIVSPANALLIFNNTTQCFEAWNQLTLSWASFGCLGCPVPAQPGVITGTSPVCQNQNGVAYSVTNVPGVTYSWTYSGTGFTIGSGSGTSSITADFSASATSGTLSVTGSNACGTSTASTLAITVNLEPSGVSASASPNPLCTGNSLTLTGGATGATSWSWTGPNGFTSALQNPAITNITTAGAGVYSLTAGNTCGLATAVNTASVNVNTVPTAVSA